MEDERFDIDAGVETIKELTWLMKNSKFFRTTIMSLANKTIISEGEIIKKSFPKPAGHQSKQKKKVRRFYFSRISDIIKYPGPNDETIQR